MFGWLPGADLDSVVRREVADLNDTRTGSADRTGAWNWQDDVGAWMAGSNKEEVLRLAGEKADAALKKALSARASLAQSNLSGILDPTYTGDVEGKTQEQLEAQRVLDETRGKALQTAMANNPRFDVSTLSPTATAGAILQASGKATVEHADEKEKEVEEKDERRYKNTKDLTIMQLLNNQEDRRADRQLRRDQQAYENRRLDLQEARLDRKDRQAALQQMMAGLAQMGASIAI